MNRSLLSVFWALLMLVSLPSVLAQDSGWPRTLPLEQGMVTIYQLQVDEMSDDIIHFRAALAYRATAGSEPVFGAGWFESRVEIDQSKRIVHPTDLKVSETRFPAGTDDVQAELSAVLAQQSPIWNLDFSLDELQAALKTAQAESKAVQNLNTAPPQIIYRDHPTLLISMDGEPVLREIENSPLEAVINTPYPLIFDGKHYYLNAAKDVWYRADKATGPYQFEASPPEDIAAMVNADEPGATDEQPVEPITAANAPEIVVSTEPAELIVTEGPAAFVPLIDDLLVLQNSDDDVFMHVSSQKYYIVLAGRWYHASSLNGPWAYQPADDLPTAFAHIPQDSNQADSRVYVAGTKEAREAVLDAQVPQTAAVERGIVDIEVEYDGEPIYQPVDGTDLVYIQNTGSTVLLSDGLYYLVEDGVWYVSSTPNGPWQVSTHRPAQVDTILPTSPVYNTKYVHVYDSTPSVVYVGYTPGYTGSYVYHNTIFYGSGWYYPPWVSPYYYYPRHSTWGFNVSYNPWYGWNFGLSWGWGPFSVGYYTGGYWHYSHYWHHRHYGRWGPGGYRPRHHGYRGYGHSRYAYNDYGRSAYSRNADSGYRSDGYQRNGNLYRDGAQRARVANTRDKQPRIPGKRGSENRQAKYTAASGSRKQNYAKQNKVGYNKAGPVSPSDMRLKADVRNTNSRANRKLLLADNSGNVYRKAARRPDRNDPVSRSSLSAKSMKNQTMPSLRTSGKNVNKDFSKYASKNGVKNSGKYVGQSGGRASGESNVKRSTQSTTIASSRKSTARAADKQPRTVSNSARQRPTQLASGPAQKQYSSRPGVQSQKQYSSRPGVQSQKQYSSRSGSQPQKQYSSRPGSPAQKQYSSRPGPQPQSSRNSGGSRSAPAQRAPQQSAHKANSQRFGSNSGGGKRAGGSRSIRS